MKETTVLSDFQNLAEHLSKVIISNNISVSERAYDLCYHLEEHAKINSLKGLKSPLTLFHKLYNHQDSLLKLTCQRPHCIECYYYFSNITDPSNFFCTCGDKIVPKHNKLIKENYIRIQGLKMVCYLCQYTKDKMNFPVCGVHGCSVCYDCIKKYYVYEKGRNNHCVQCGVYYDKESETILRTMQEEEIKNERGEEYVKVMTAAFYEEECWLCKKLKDSRTFSQVCENHHFACKECVDREIRSKTTNCLCEALFSAINK